MSRLAIIPARGGSKRIPRKNIKDFFGKPIIAYSIETALNSGLFDEVMVSTDDAEIAEIAIKHGAKIPFFRSKDNANDFATTVSVLKEVLQEYSKLGKIFNEVCCIYPAAPLIKIEHLQTGLDILKDDCNISVFPAVEFSFPIWRSLKIDDKNYATFNWPKHFNARSQDLPKAYHDAGQWYWFKPDKIKDSLVTNYSKVIIIAENEVQDIDNLTDWSLAEIKFTLIQKNDGKI